MVTKILRRSLLATVLACTTALAAEAPVKVIGLAELTGSGATAGTNYNNGVKLAVKEINAAGGLLGHPIDYSVYDTQTNPGVAKALARKAADDDALLVMGPAYSGSIIVSEAETRRAGIPNFVAGEAANLTMQGNPFIFRSSLSQTDSMPRVGTFLKDTLHAGKVAVVFANDDFGTGGRDLIQKALKQQGIADVADISTDPGQVDMSSVVLKAKQSGADALFVYLHEEESARLIRELRKQGYDKPIVGETTLTNEKVLELAGDAANGIMGHVGLLADAPNPNVEAFTKRYRADYGSTPDHNALKGYLSMETAAAMVRRVGKLDRKAIADGMKNARIDAADNPGVLMDVQYDDKGDLDRETYIVRVENGKQKVIQTLPLGAVKK